ncbi:hypothetical protein DRE_04729 [Drechslerella stenobrocha 248]|uniref:DUF962 domain-containing protein n=1 Tax=Drechslerella stenobrocha 248 TaxID=1043628 RepID=W7HP97_9PEZI|nr:hypothetical protein DRE_04729 [Drechslerella stenobrocha 248]
MPSLDLEKQLTFYGAYHHNQVNKGIHMIFVPLILMTSFLLAGNSGALVDLPYLPLNAGTAACFLYSILYILMEPVAGALVAPLLFGGTAYMNTLRETHGNSANVVALVIHLTSWIFQFIGHGAFEHRSPALLDNIFQAFFLAPFFVWFELLFSLGYRPELRSRIDAAVVKEIAKFRASKAKAATNGTTNGKATNGKSK